MSPAQSCFALTPYQLRRAHDFDWQCCSKIFNLPLRSCRTVEPDNVPSVISEEQFNNIMDNIKQLWEKWSHALEVFYDDKEPEKGWRLRVHQTYPLPKLHIPERDQSVQIGWSAACPDTGPSAHLYKRSPCEVNGYLGGIISLSNQAKSKVIVRKDSKGPQSWKVYFSKVNLAPGDELFWSYGGAVLGTTEQWSLTCCCEIDAHSIARGPRLPASHRTLPKAKTTCLLCGYDLTSKSEARDQPSNFKGHYARCHLSYFCSDSPIEWDDAMYELEIFHKVIAGLKSKKYAVRFCSSEGLTSNDGSQEEKFNSFKETYNMLRMLDILLLKGDKVPQDADDLRCEPVTTWSDNLKKKPNYNSFTYVNAKLEREEIEKVAEERIYNIINHRY